MKLNRFYRLVFCLVVLVICGASLSAKEKKESKYATNPARVHDYGVIEEGAKPKHTFKFANETKSPIKVLKFRLPCGCGKITKEKDIVEPGKVLEFTMEFNSEGRRGKVAKNIYMVTDSKQTPIIKYTIRADIKPKPFPAEISPGKINAGTIAPKSQKELKFKIVNRQKKKLKISRGAMSPLLKLNFKLPLEIPPESEQEFTFKYTAPSYTGGNKCNLMLRTNNPQVGNLWVVVVANIQPPPPEKKK